MNLQNLWKSVWSEREKNVQIPQPTNKKDFFPLFNEAFVVAVFRANRECQVSVNNRQAAWGVIAAPVLWCCSWMEMREHEEKRKRSAFYKVLVSREAAPLHNHKSPRWKYGVRHTPTSRGGFGMRTTGLAVLMTAWLQVFEISKSICLFLLDVLQWEKAATQCLHLNVNAAMSPLLRTNGCQEWTLKPRSPAEVRDLWPQPVSTWGQLQSMRVILFVRRKLNKEQHWGMTGMCFHWRQLQKRAAKGRTRINVGAKLSSKGLLTWAEAED